MANLKSLFSSNSDEWSTPDDFFEKLNSIYKFTLDPCANENNKKTKLFYSKDEDGLTKDWEGHSVFMNPPYSKVKDWMKKAFEEGGKDNTTVVCLIPSRTDTSYWHNYCFKSKEIHFIRGRLKFSNSKNSAPFPSAVVVFSKEKLEKINSIVYI